MSDRADDEPDARPRAAGDHFSGMSSAYAEFRPRYPRALFEFIASIAPRHTLAWDCGAGNGQATLDLVEWFEAVIATDVSAQQLAQAPSDPRITWRVAPAEDSGIASHSVDATTVATAMHWFDHARFAAEVRRVSAPGAVIVAWAYETLRLEGAVGEAVRAFAEGPVASYWPPERHYVDEGYRTIPFPFERIATPELELVERWTRGQTLGYLRTWSSVSRFQKAHGHDPVSDLERELDRLWPDPTDVRTVRWRMPLLAGRVGA
jgi:SAM-dependent methyltransferase